MKKFAIRSCSLIMALVLAIGLCISASATEFAPYASDYLSKYQGTVTAQGNGVVKISFLVIGTERIDEIGASKIVVQEKDGNSWIPVKTYNNVDNPELSTTNDFSYSNYVLFDGDVGKTYRAKIIIFGNTDFRTFTTASTIATR